MAEEDAFPPGDERARDEAAEEARVDAEDLTTEGGDPPVETEAGRAFGTGLEVPPRTLQRRERLRGSSPPARRPTPPAPTSGWRAC